MDSPVSPAVGSPERSTPPPLDPVKLLAAAGDPVRWAILRELAAGSPLIVLELARRLGKSADLISKHLRVLRACGAVVIRTTPGEDGRKAFYEVPAACRPAVGVLDYGSCALRYPAAANES